MKVDFLNRNENFLRISLVLPIFILTFAALTAIQAVPVKACLQTCGENFRVYTCESTCTCDCPADGWYETDYTQTKNEGCMECVTEEYRDYSCDGEDCGCSYEVTETRETCNNVNEGQVCNLGIWDCQDSCSRAQEEFTCQEGSCQFSVWTNLEVTNPFTCEWGQATETCCLACGAECEVDSDCGENGWHGTTDWVESDCETCRMEEYRDYDCEGCSCHYEIIDTREFCEDVTEGECTLEPEPEPEPECEVDSDCSSFCEGSILFYDGQCAEGECNLIMEDCNGLDGWYGDGELRWIDVDDCNEKEQVKEVYYDYSCSAEDVMCAGEVTDERWEDTGETREKDSCCGNGPCCKFDCYWYYGDDSYDGGTIGRLQSCELNGICDEWEDEEMCPSDCGDYDNDVYEIEYGGNSDNWNGNLGELGICNLNGICEDGEDYNKCPTDCEYVLVAECGNDICEEGEDDIQCPGDCLVLPEVGAPALPQPSGPIVSLGMFGIGSLNFLILLLVLLVVGLGVIRYGVLPRQDEENDYYR